VLKVKMHSKSDAAKLIKRPKIVFVVVKQLFFAGIKERW